MDPGPGPLLSVSELSSATSSLICPQCSAPICGAMSVLGSPSLLSESVPTTLQLYELNSNQWHEKNQTKTKQNKAKTKTKL